MDVTFDLRTLARSSNDWVRLELEVMYSCVNLDQIQNGRPPPVLLLLTALYDFGERRWRRFRATEELPEILIPTWHLPTGLSFDLFYYLRSRSHVLPQFLGKSNDTHTTRHDSVVIIGCIYLYRHDSVNLSFLVLSFVAENVLFGCVARVLDSRSLARIRHVTVYYRIMMADEKLGSQWGSCLVCWMTSTHHQQI